MDKDELRNKLLVIREEYITKNHARLDKIKPRWETNQQNVPVLEDIDPVLVMCDTDEEHALWYYGRVTTSSAPMTGDVGRRFQWFIKDRKTGFILGIVGLSSSLSIPLFDKYIGWKKTAKWSPLKRMNNTMNMSHCVATPPYNVYLTGKLCALSCTSQEIINRFELGYGDYAACFMTTSLFGKSSMYNRLEGFEYLGNTKGYSAALVPLAIKQQMRKEYQAKHGKHAEIYTKPDGTIVKYGTVKTFQKLGKYATLQRVENLRGVYAIPLADNFKEFLCGEQEYLDSWKHETFDTIKAKWRERWFLPRIQRMTDGD
jgi:hypothetical protein